MDLEPATCHGQLSASFNSYSSCSMPIMLLRTWAPSEALADAGAVALYEAASWHGVQRAGGSWKWAASLALSCACISMARDPRWDKKEGEGRRKRVCHFEAIPHVSHSPSTRHRPCRSEPQSRYMGKCYPSVDATGGSRFIHVSISAPESSGFDG